LHIAGFAEGFHSHDVGQIDSVFMALFLSLLYYLDTDEHRCTRI